MRCVNMFVIEQSIQDISLPPRLTKTTKLICYKNRIRVHNKRHLFVFFSFRNLASNFGSCVSTVKSTYFRCCQLGNDGKAKLTWRKLHNNWRNFFKFFFKRKFRFVLWNNSDNTNCVGMCCHFGTEIRKSFMNENGKLFNLISFLFFRQYSSFATKFERKITITTA